MAKTLAKLLPMSRRNMIKLEQKKNWICMELETLPGDLQEKKNQKIAKFNQKANKKIAGAAFEACDKGAYADCVLNERMQAYDKKAYLSHRRIQNAAARAIFKAVKSEKDWSAALDNMLRQNQKLAEKRSAYLEKQIAQRDAFLKSHSGSDSARYDALMAQLTQERTALIEELDKVCQAKFDQKNAALLRKKEKLQAKLASAKAGIENAYQMDADTVLSVRGLKMYFGGLKAVDDLTFDVKRGEIFGLIGPNGAGKTTVFNCITQFYKPTDGTLLLQYPDGQIIRLTDFQVHDIVLKGIARTFQNVEVVKEVSVLDNLLIAATRQYTSNLVTQMFHLPHLGREEKAIRAKADRILKYMDLAAYRDRLAWGLPYGVLKRIEIARALMCNPQLVILDEPAAGLNESETRDLANLIRRIRDDFGCTVLLVEHDMSLVMNVCDHICAISFGRRLAYGTAEEIQASKEVQEAYLGTGGT